MIYHGIKIDDDKIEAFCKRNKIVRFALFGSILRDDFSPDSDVDVLVELAPDSGIGFFGLAKMEQDLTKILGHPSEIHTYEGLHPLYRDEVIRLAEVRYEQT